MLAAKPNAAKFMIMIKATGKTAQIHVIDLHFPNRVAVQGNHDKPIREGFFSNYCQALEEPFKGDGDSATLGPRQAGTASREAQAGRRAASSRWGAGSAGLTPPTLKGFWKQTSGLRSLPGDVLAQWWLEPFPNVLGSRIVPFLQRGDSIHL